ncbi:4-diphosphocytidyl-2-C-methyl-D-erythritol kinase [Candidatus Providencia siddallii]|uniref:4-diphosphocytidyl-2-C-methyl-D-erythritol kinase n=1 Tax=Candidatus Providencia siddallii TaxID=1715285 RepID=A0A0M6W8I6_9GAMM|nr:4-diphosphocytidyl-2-C-methyl-D-erythritol kinase [Candidatus Providencia siddallii]
MTLTWPSPGKLNLFLYINSYRHDGYHEIQTLYQFLRYGDKITITNRLDNQLNLLSKISGVKSKDNLILRAARLLQKYCYNVLHCKKKLGADISFKKYLPIGGGVGGGSSNAATTLIALNEHWGTKISDSILAKIGKIIGADVPVFVKGYSCFAEGIGEILTPILLKENWYLVANNGIKISTKKIFSDPLLKRNSKKQTLNVLLLSKYSNDCELTVRRNFYEVDRLISWLLKYSPSRLTGTGSCVFSEFKTKYDAIKVLNNSPLWLHGFVAQGTNESPLHKFRALATNMFYK